MSVKPINPHEQYEYCFNIENNAKLLDKRILFHVTYVTTADVDVFELVLLRIIGL